MATPITITINCNILWKETAIKREEQRAVLKLNASFLRALPSTDLLQKQRKQTLRGVSSHRDGLAPEWDAAMDKSHNAARQELPETALVWRSMITTDGKCHQSIEAIFCKGAAQTQTGLSPYPS